eukprot:UN03297
MKFILMIDSISMLIRLLDGIPLNKRRIYYQQLLNCRRRIYSRVNDSPVSKLFILPSRFHLLKQRTLAWRLRYAIMNNPKTNLTIYDSFRAIDNNKDGQIQAAELYGAFFYFKLQKKINNNNNQEQKEKQEKDQDEKLTITNNDNNNNSYLIQHNDILDLMSIVHDNKNNSASSTIEGNLTYRDFCCLLRAGITKVQNAKNTTLLTSSLNLLSTKNYQFNLQNPILLQQSSSIKEQQNELEYDNTVLDNNTGQDGSGAGDGIGDDDDDGDFDNGMDNNDDDKDNDMEDDDDDDDDDDKNDGKDKSSNK